jgi:SAM-dependent methyltransferase
MQYTALRRREGWVGPEGIEDPDRGDRRLWGGRLEAVAEAAAALANLRAGGMRPVVLDIGSGGGWAARYIRDADVIAIDLVEAPAPAAVLRVRADMRRLPLRDATADVAFFAASLHYAPVADSVHEAARVLRPGGLVVAVDSPMYRDRDGQARAKSRSAPYYSAAGFPDLAQHYHPIDITSLRSALAEANFEVIRLDEGRAGRLGWLTGGRRRHSSFLAARLKRKT